ncbi:MAG: cation diffusion facilitator family transporter [Rhodospirillales bacterium]|nr:cation diffusion facilitator family transporter [Rhodospirillales bacterium]
MPDREWEENKAGTAQTGDSSFALDIEQANRLKKRAAIASVTVATVLIATKTVAWFATGSVSMLSTMIDSFLDLAASLINLLAIRHAAIPADKEHRFGHGKAEPLAGLGQAAFIGGSALFLVVEATQRLVHPQPVENATIGVLVMVFSIAVTSALVLYQKWVIRRTASIAIGADSLHYLSDLLVNLGVILALVLVTQLGWARADPLIALAVALFIVYSAWEVLQTSLNLLMDRELPVADRERIEELARSHPGVRNLHDLRTRSSGTQVFIQLHLEMEPQISLSEAHRISDQVMDRIEESFPGAEVLIHEDPYGVDEKRQEF